MCIVETAGEGLCTDTGESCDVDEVRQFTISPCIVCERLSAERTAMCVLLGSGVFVRVPVQTDLAHVGAALYVLYRLHCHLLANAASEVVSRFLKVHITHSTKHVIGSISADVCPQSFPQYPGNALS